MAAEAIRRSHLSDTLQRGEEKPGGSSPGVWRSMGSNGGRVGQGYFSGRKAPEHEKPIAMTMAFCFQSRIVRRTNPLDSSILPMSKHPQYEVHRNASFGETASIARTDVIINLGGYARRTPPGETEHRYSLLEFFPLNLLCQEVFGGESATGFGI